MHFRFYHLSFNDILVLVTFQSAWNFIFWDISVSILLTFQFWFGPPYLDPSLKICKSDPIFWTPLFGPVYFYLSIWTRLFWPVHLNPSFWTPLFGPVYLNHTFPTFPLWFLSPYSFLSFYWFLSPYSFFPPIDFFPL